MKSFSKPVSVEKYMARTIDLNCDMGEGFGIYEIGDDAAMLDIVTTANIACGFHGGDPLVMHRTIEIAKAKGVRVGAHPSFLDLWGFGRRPIQGERPQDVEKHLIYQIGAIQAMATALGWPITHVKTHGALGNMAAVDADLAEACVSAVKAVDPALAFITLPFSQTYQAAEAAGLPVICEVFADRTYDDAGQLTSRKLPGAMIHDVDQATEHAIRMVVDGEILTTGGRRLPVNPQSICVHGDTPGAVAIARQLRTSLEGANLSIASFVK
jgi:UPF0271 protein